MSQLLISRRPYGLNSLSEFLTCGCAQMERCCALRLQKEVEGCRRTPDGHGTLMVVRFDQEMGSDF